MNEQIKIGLLIATIIAIVIMLIGYVYLQEVNNNQIPDHPTQPTDTPLPTPTPGPSVPFDFRVGIDFSSAKGFDLTQIEAVNVESNPCFVLSPGKSGTLSIRIISTGNVDYNLSLSLEYADFDGLSYSFTPNIVFLKAGQEEISILRVEIDGEASIGFTQLTIFARTDKGGLGFGGLNLLIVDYTPSFIFKAGGLADGNILMPKPPGWTPPESTIPIIKLDNIDEVKIMLFIIESPLLTLNTSSNPQLDYILEDQALNFQPRPEYYNAHLLTFRLNPTTPTGRYNVTLNGVANAFNFSRAMLLDIIE